MLNKKQMLALMLGASAMGASYAVDKAELANAAIQKFKDTMATLNPLVNAFAKKAQQGNFDGIAQDLSKVDLVPAITFLVENMDNIKEKFVGFVKILKEQAPADYKAVAESTARMVEEKLALLNDLKANLEIVKEYGNLKQRQSIIAQALTAAHNDKGFRDELTKIINDSKKALLGLLKQINQIDPEKIQESLDKAPDLYAAFQNGTLSLDDIEVDVAPGIGEIRKKLLPVAPAIAAELSATVLDIYRALSPKGDVLKQFALPTPVVDALGKINEIGVQLKQDFEGLNIKITELMKQVF